MDRAILTSQLVNIFIIAFLGGISGAWVFDRYIDQMPDLKPSAGYANTSSTMQEYFNNYNKRSVFIGSHEGNGGLFLFDENGSLRAQMGSYSVGNEKGQSLIGLNDRNAELRFLTRLYGPKDVPTIIFKDNSGRDQIVFGLDAVNQTPYFHYRTPSGKMQDLIPQP